MGLRKRYGGKEAKISLIFLVIFLFFGFLTQADAQGLGQQKDQKENYNIILIIIDDLRADHLGCYGYPHNISPTIDKIAKDSWLFENAFSQAGYTIANTMSILTSLYPSSHGLLFIYKDKLSPRVQTMAEILQAYGYRTAWFSLLKNSHLDIDIGFGRGFQDKEELSIFFDGRQELISWLEKNQENKFFLAMDTRRVHDFARFFQPTVFKGNSAQDKKELDNVLKEIKRAFYDKLVQLAKSGKPPFDDPKIIFDNQELFNGVYSTEKENQIRELLVGVKKQQMEDIKSNIVESLTNKIAGKNHKLWIAAYDACILAVDNELIEPLQEKLKALELYDKTIIIITADHGEAFGEHGYYGHTKLFPEVNHVPLIIKIPYAKKGKTTNALVQSIDIMPTILELAGIEKPHQAQGKSLVNLMTGTNVFAPNKYVFEENFGTKSIRSKEWRFHCPLPGKYKRKGGGKELYNLAQDPGEHKNVYFLEPDVASKLESELKQWEATLPSYKDQEHPFSPEIDKAGQERIKETGYW